MNMSSAVFPLKWLMESWLHNRTFAISVASLLTVLVRLGTGFAFGTYRFDRLPDHWAFGYEWGRIANWLVQKGMFSLDGAYPTTSTDPLYVLVIASFFYVFGSFTTSAAVALIILQSLLDGLTAWAMFVLGERVYGPLEARVCSLLFAFYPASIFFAAGRIGPSNLTILLLCLVFLVTFTLADFPRLKFATLAGFVTGLLILTSSKPLSLIIIIPLWLFWVGKKRRLSMLFASFIFITSATLVMLPWAVRNSLIAEHPTITKQGLGLMLWVGNNPDATGYTFNPPEPRLEEHVYVQLALSWIANNPGDFLLLTLKRIIIFWSVIPRGVSITDIFNGLVFLIATGLAMAGALWPGERSERVWLFLLFFAIFPLVFYVTAVPAYRHRFHIEPLMLILAGRGIHRLCARFYPVPVLRLSSHLRRHPNLVES
jgi:4-amino-4-deoxy-L-arabinose transferase-like glycosyltransferase